MALGVVRGEIERSRLRVLRMIGTMAAGGNAFADDLNKFFADEPGSEIVQCREPSALQRNGPRDSHGFAVAGMAAELAISHFPPCLTNVLM